MPPPRQYPGLGPLPDYLGYTTPDQGVGEGTRAYGMDMLRQMFEPPTVQEEEYRRLRERYMGPMRRSVEEAMGAPMPKRTVPERIQDQRAETEKAYYGTPMPNAPFEQQGIKAPDLGPSASGEATPTPTDQRMLQAMMDALTGFGVGLIGRGFRYGGIPAEEAMTYFLRSRRNPENAVPNVAAGENRQSGETVEQLAAEASPGNKKAGYKIQQLEPPEGYPMDKYLADPRYTPGYNRPDLPFYFQ